MRVGELARRTGAAVRALRYYEAAGLVVPARLPNGYRDCAEAANAYGIHAAWGSANGTAPTAARIARRPSDVVALVRQLQTQ